MAYILSRSVIMRLIFLILFLASPAFAQSTTERIHVTENNIAVGSVTGSYQTLLTNTNPLRDLSVVNNANCNIFVSFDGSTDHDYLPANTARDYPLAEISRHISSNVSIKHDGTACSAGYISASGGY